MLRTLASALRSQKELCVTLMVRGNLGLKGTCGGETVKAVWGPHGLLIAKEATVGSLCEQVPYSGDGF